MSTDLEEFYLECKSIPVCDFATMLQHQQNVENVCCIDNNCHGSTTPIAISECPLTCGKTFEPFWDDCGKPIKAMGMAGQVCVYQKQGIAKSYAVTLLTCANLQMDDFYINCLVTLYPPGKCSGGCDGECPFHCRLQEINSGVLQSHDCAHIDTFCTTMLLCSCSRCSYHTACCGRDGCKDGEITPADCSVECALVFAPFMDDCEDLLASLLAIEFTLCSESRF